MPKATSANAGNSAMPSLSEQQQAFSAALTDEALAASPAFLARFADTPARARRRFAAYQRNVRGNWRMALRASYPVLATLIGEARFAALSDEYLTLRPSRDADLNRYGAELADFLGEHPLREALPYLPDLAHLEWMLQEIYGAQFDGAPDLSALSALPAEHQGDLVVRLATSTARAIRSAWPISEIWQAHQHDDLARRDGELAEISLTPSEHLVMVSRLPAGGFFVTRLSAGEAAFRAACEAALTLEEGLQAALAAEPALEVANLLPNWLARGWISAFELPSGARSCA